MNEIQPCLADLAAVEGRAGMSRRQAARNRAQVRRMSFAVLGVLLVCAAFAMLIYINTLG